MIVINFKNYAAGKKALKLAKLIERYLPHACAAVSAFDIEEISKKTKLKVYAQHVDYFEKKATTGFIIPEYVKAAGAVGTLLNHSEHQLRPETIAKTIKRCEETNLKVLLCVADLKQAKKYVSFEPYAVAFEDSELIGSGKSITEFRSQEVKKFVSILKNSATVPLCGAGIHSAEDLKTAYTLGCKGILISSAIANVPLKKAEKLLKEIAVWKR